MQRIKNLLLAAALTACPAAAHALMPSYAGARALGMGGAFSTLATENAGLYWNPACLGAIDSREVTAMLTQDGLDTRSSFAAYGQPISDWGGVAGGWSRTANTFERTDTGGSALGSGEVSSNIYLLGASYYHAPPLSIGVTAKYINERVDSFVLGGWAMDVGLLFDRLPFRCALVGQNILSTGLSGASVAGSGSVSESIMPNLRFGASYLLGRTCPVETKGPDGAPDNLDLVCTLALDADVPLKSSEKISYSPGIELWLNDVLGLRGGLREMRDYTAGISLQVQHLRLDYAFIYSQNLENTHLLSTSLFF